MKKYLFFVFALLLLPLAAISQDTLVVAQPGEVPEIPDVNFLIANFGMLMLTFTGIAAIASFVGEFLIRILKSTKKAIKIVFVLVLSVGLTFLAGVLFKNSDYALMLWWQKIFWGLLSGAAAAGLRGTNLLFLKSVVEFVIGLILSKEPKE